ncbi:choice-of-anchor I family protein [Prosthecochloris vibrioformis]|uniref:LTD domain-containing protein n=1 Tax=Prosthecochloris vibrioformis TaxID=1098 RepID=A0A5C4RSH8_PROVB|nr:choice-of-anchor I family protein [Prosthecochloris vibrioformis]TNJ34110.1 hypothetical protein FGF68_10215 [Prosthecochloris vibrioformis]
MALNGFNENTYSTELLSALQGAVPGDLKISVISDPHYFAPSLLVNDGAAFEAYLAEDRKMIAESDAILNSALDMVSAENPDILLIPGDLTKDGEKVSHEAFAAYLADLEANGTKVYVVPGNHDINNPHAVSYDGATETPVASVTPEEFATIYDEFGYGEALYRDPASLSYIAAPTNDLWILALDSCEYDDNATSPETDGSLSLETVAWALEKLAEAKLQGITVLGMMHHSLAEHFSLQDDLFSDYVVDGSETLAELFADAGLQIMFTGHFHANDINTLDTERPLTEIETGSLVTWPSPVRTISLENGVLDISTASVTDIDYDTGDQTFPEYAVDFLDTGLNELAVSYLVASFGITEEAAGQVAPYFAQAMAAHYMGDETISAEIQQVITTMASSGDQMQMMLAGALQSLLTDGLPGDNNTTIQLVNPWEGMSVDDLAEVLAAEYSMTPEEHYDSFHRLIITEVNSKAEGEDYFELYNYGDTAINLDGWKWIDSDADFTSADAIAIGDITLMPGETLVVVSTDAVDAEASFREAWGLGDDVQVIVTDGKGLGGDDAVVVFDAMGNTAAALNYGTAAVTTSDSIVVDPVMLSNGTSSLGGHAGEAAGAFETTSLVWTGDSAEEPVYTYAAEGMIGGTEQQNPEDGTGSPGTATTNVATHLDTFTVGGEGAAEISAYDATTQKLFVTNAELNRIDVLDLSNPSNVTRLTSIDISAYGGNVNSVAVHGGRLAMAIEADVKQDPGKVVVLSTDDFSELASVTVGALPDMVTFTPDGNFILSANEGEPNADYSVDPDGTVSIIDTSDYSVTTLDFSAFNDKEEALEAEGMRVFGPGADLAADVEPEYITVSDDSATAWVALQENNAIAEVDLASKTITAIHPLGFKDYSLDENAFDASDKDGEINITTWPVKGIYMPDSLASYAVNGTTYLVTANEGDAREYDTFEEEARIEDLTLDEIAFPDAETLQTDDAIGRLKVTTTLGDTDNDGDYDELYSFGARSFTIWTEDGELVFDSGSDIETITSILNSSIFNQDEGDVDERSDAKGPEPEGLAVGEVDGHVYAFVGLERTGGVMVYDITTPEDASFVQWIYTEGDVAPEGLLFIDETDTLVVSNEVSGTVSTYSIGEPDYVEESYTLQLLHFADAEAGLLASETAPNLAALVDVFEDEYANSITLAGGDNFIPGPFLAAGTDPGVADVLEEITGISYASQGTVDIAIHNVIGVEASTIGNHEFDLGSRGLKDAFAYAADFPYLSANLDFSGDDDLSGLYVDTVAEEGLDGELASDLAGNIVPSAVLEEGGEKIGLVGATTQLLESISSPSGTEVIGTDQTDMELLAAQLQPVIDDLVAQGVNKIILMAHLQVIANEIELAGKLSGVDIILAAGSNTRLGDSDDEAVAFDGHAAEFADTYPLELTDKDGNTILLVNTDNEFTYLGRLVVDFDADGNIITDSIQTHTSINGAYAATEENVAEAWDVDVADLATTAFAEGSRGADVAALTDAVQNVIDEKNSNVFGYSDVYLEGERALVRSEETNLGDLSADANGYAAELAMGSEAASSTYIVSLKNGGGIRAQIGTVSAPDPVDGTTEQLPPADGTVTQLDVENSLRFDNQLMMFDTTPEGLKAILEHGVAEGTLQGRFPQVGGFSFSWDPDFEAGERVRDIALVGDDDIIPLYDDGVLLDTAPETISMVTLSFLAEGGDGYPMKEYGENFRYIIDNEDGTVTLSEAIDESLDFTVADNVPGGETSLGEQAAFEAYMEEFHATAETAYDEAETPAAEDTRIQNLNERDEAVLPGDLVEGSSVNGSVTFWKTGEALEDVQVGLEAMSLETADGYSVDIRNLQEGEDGTVSMEVWAASPDALESLQLEFMLPDGSSYTWEDTEELPTGWASLQNTGENGEFILAGYGIGGFAGGEDVMLGALTLDGLDDVDQFEVALAAGELNTEELPGFRFVAMRDMTDAAGQFIIEAVPEGEYRFSAFKETDEHLANSVSAADALAALKLAVGMNPNSEEEVSSYQYLAADVNQDGRVRATDALAILKMAVDYDGALADEWLFFQDEAGATPMSRLNVAWESEQEVIIDQNLEVDLVGVVKGDVDGSWGDMIQ